MNSTSFILVIIALVCISQSNAVGVFSLGKCPNVPDKPDFLVNQYLGSWYNYANSWNSFQIGTKCTLAVYEQTPIANRISIKNTAVYSFLPILQANGDGYAVAVDPIKAPNKLQAFITPQFLGQPIQTSGNPGKYWVAETDYFSYSIVYTCTEQSMFFFTTKEEYVFLLTRSKKPSNATIATIKSKIQPYFDINRVMYTVQDCDN